MCLFGQHWCRLNWLWYGHYLLFRLSDRLRVWFRDWLQICSLRAGAFTCEYTAFVAVQIRSTRTCLTSNDVLLYPNYPCLDSSGTDIVEVVGGAIICLLSLFEIINKRAMYINWLTCGCFFCFGNSICHRDSLKTNMRVNVLIRKVCVALCRHGFNLNGLVKW